MTCEQCERECQHRQVEVRLENNKRVLFCSDSCKERWLLAELVRCRRFMNRIYISTRGKARLIAKTALHTNHPA